VRSLYDCPEVPVGSEGVPCRVVIATHPASNKKSPVGVTRAGVVYELFFTNLPQRAFTASDVVEVYLHRGAFEPQQAAEDQEIDEGLAGAAIPPGGRSVGPSCRNGSPNLRLELGHVLKPEPLRTTEFAPAYAESTEQQPCTCGYGKPAVAAPWKAGRFSGQDFALQADGTLRCPANQTLSVHERRKEADGSLRVVYGASIRSCRPCPLREQCQWSGAATAKPRQVSVLLHPVVVGSSPLLWRDWRRRDHRRACIQLLRHQQVEVQVQPAAVTLTGPPAPLSRAERAHYRLAWEERLARNARTLAAGQVTIQLFGVPEPFAMALGLASA
jgi:hypothetical protein